MVLHKFESSWVKSFADRTHVLSPLKLESYANHEVRDNEKKFVPKCFNIKKNYSPPTVFRFTIFVHASLHIDQTFVGVSKVQLCVTSSLHKRIENVGSRRRILQKYCKNNI